MSRTPLSISRVLDGLQAWGEEPVVAPARPVDGHQPPVPVGRFEGWGWSLGRALVTFAVLWGITFAHLWSTGGGVHFIYAEF